MLHQALSRSGFPGVLVLAVATFTLSAQPPPPKPPPVQPQLLAATFVTLNQGMTADYEAYLKNELIPAQKQGGLPARRRTSTARSAKGRSLRPSRRSRLWRSTISRLQS